MSIKSFIGRTLKFAVPALIAGGIAIASPTEASAQVVEVGVGVPVGVNYYPPAAYIATAQPEYYQNRPVYYYNNSWYYRDHGRWSYYRRARVPARSARVLGRAPLRRRTRGPRSAALSLPPLVDSDLLGVLAQEMVDQDQRHHRLHDRHRAR